MGTGRAAKKRRAVIPKFARLFGEFRPAIHEATSSSSEVADVAVSAVISPWGIGSAGVCSGICNL
jgi:hypothetical protein